MKGSPLEELFAYHLVMGGVPDPQREYPFAACVGRRFRFDFAWPEKKIYVEVEGGAWIGGRHNRPCGFSRDTTKYNLATMLGWRGLRFTADAIRKRPQECVAMVRELLGVDGEE